MMFARIKELLAPPVFEDEAKTRSAKLLNTILLITLAATVIGTALIIPMEPEEWVLNLVFGAIITAFLLGLRLLMRRGRVRLAGALVSLILWGSITFLVIIGAGVKDISLAAYFLTIVLASFFLGGRGALISGGLTIVTVLVLLSAEISGLMTFAARDEVGVIDGVTLSISLGLTALLLHFTVESMIRALRQAEQKERAQREANMALREIRVSLEERVAARTQDLQQRSEQLQLVVELGRRVAALQEDVEAMLEEVAQQMVELWGVARVGIYLTTFLEGAEAEEKERQSGSRRVYLRAVGGAEEGSGLVHLPPDLGVNDDTLVSTAMVRLVPISSPLAAEARVELAVPLLSGDRLIGVLDVLTCEGQEFSEDAKAILRLLADQLAVMLENARLLQEARENVERVQRAYGEVSEERWSDALESRFDLSYYSDAKQIEQSPLIWDATMEKARVKGQVVREVDSEKGYKLAVPIKVRDEVIGVMNTYKPMAQGDWTAEEIALMRQLRDNLGVALESARLYEDTQRRAARERLTGEVTARIRETLDVNEVLQTATREMRQVLDLAEVEIRMGLDTSEME